MNDFKSISAKIKNIRNVLKNDFKVKSIAIFGSVSRGTNTKNSDLDLLVEFSEPIGTDIVNLFDRIEETVNLHVDIVAKSDITNSFFNYIKDDLKYVF